MLQRLRDRLDRADAHDFRIDAGQRIGAEGRQRLQPKLLARFSAHDETAAAPSLICEELPAVTVPPV